MVLFVCPSTHRPNFQLELNHAPQAQPALSNSSSNEDNEIAPNELVMKLQPEEAVYVKTNVKSPGLTTKPITAGT